MAPEGPQEERVGSVCLELRALYGCRLLLGTSVGERSRNLTFGVGGFPVCTPGIRLVVGDTRKISWPVYLQAVELQTGKVWQAVREVDKCWGLGLAW